MWYVDATGAARMVENISSALEKKQDVIESACATSVVGHVLVVTKLAINGGGASVEGHTLKI